MKRLVVQLLFVGILFATVLESCSSYQCPAYSTTKKAKPLKGKGNKKERFKD